MNIPQPPIQTAPPPARPVGTARIINGLAVVQTIPSTFVEAKRALLGGHTQETLLRLSSKELNDYTSIDNTLRDITNMVHTRMAELQLDGTWANRVQVIPRGSYISKTALMGSADLDIDLIIPDDYQITYTIGTQNYTKSIREALVLDRFQESILFAPEALKAVLQSVWTKLGTAGAGQQVPRKPNDHLVATEWLELKRDATRFTRSIDARTIGEVAGIGDNGLSKKLDVDLFIKIRTKLPGALESERGGGVIIVGVDKDGPEGMRRYQQTEYLPTEGRWVGDRVLRPSDRVALLLLKWWKNELELPIKSHHLLTALNSLHELDPSDPLYLPEKTSERFSVKLVMKIMKNILTFLNSAYISDCSFLLERRKADRTWDFPDYPFSQLTRGVQDSLFVQYSQDGKPQKIGLGDVVEPEELSSYQKLLNSRNPAGQNFIEVMANELTAAIALLH